MQSHEFYMQRALELAARGTGCTSPNPLVGSVVVRNGDIIGEGWHKVYGHNHAEVNALNDAARQIRSAESGTNAHAAIHGATLYVTLEPCHHHGLTPPCSQAIVRAGVSQVVYALADPNPQAAGGGEWLKAQGIDIVTSVLEESARFQNRFFLKHVASRLPYVIAKTATSLDGRVATRTGHSQWITGPEARQRGHQLRQSVDAIIVGADTVIADNPSLTTRLPGNLCAAGNIRHPRPVILDSKGRVPLNSKLLSGSLPTRSLLITTSQMDTQHRLNLESQGVEVVSIDNNPHGPGVDPKSLMHFLGQQGIQSVLLEGGPVVQGTFRDAGLIDEVWAFIAPKVLGGVGSRAAYAAMGTDSLQEATQLHDVHVELTGQDVLIRGCVTNTLAVTQSTVTASNRGDTANGSVSTTPHSTSGDSPRLHNADSRNKT